MKQPFFRRADWIAFAIAFLVSLTVYTLTLQPTVGLEDSGELIVASDYLGVPHPPGYPIWSLLTWAFQWVFHKMTYHGYPNPAWAVNFFSAFAGAAACSVLALLVSRSGTDFLRSLKKVSATLGDRTERVFCCVAGISAGLLLAFSQGMWSQSVIAEVYSLNIFFQTLMILFLYRWMVEPDNPNPLFLMAFTYGLGMTNHQTIVFMGLAVALAVFLRTYNKPVREFICFVVALLFGALGVGLLLRSNVFSEESLNIFALFLSMAFFVVTTFVARMGLKRVSQFLLLAFLFILLSGLGVLLGELILLILGALFATVCLLCIKERSLFRDFALVGAIYLLCVGVQKWAPVHIGVVNELLPEVTSSGEQFALKLRQAKLELLSWKAGPTSAMFWVWNIIFLSVPALLAFKPRKWIGILGITVFYILLFSVLNRALVDISWMECFGHDARWIEILQKSSIGVWGHEFKMMGTSVLIQGFENPIFITTFIFVLLVPVLLWIKLPDASTVCATYLLMFLGLSFYLYMPFASEQNPPINWGYPRTWEGFMHAITRGQYEKVTMANVFSLRFLQQIGAYLHDLRSQFFGPTALLALVPFVSLPWIGKKNRAWFLTTVLAFIGVGIIFMILQNPKLDIQTLFIARVQYIQSHAIYAIWLGYGLLLMMALLETWVKNNSFTKFIGVALVAALPFSLVYKNYFSEKQLQVVGGSEQNGHDFGWQFGNWQLQGVEGIKKDLWYYCGKDEEKFAEEWAEYPNPDYPPPMGTNAIFFGGTDPGRFVPTYMIYCPRVRDDVYLITQNALADGTFMDVTRDLYGDQIWIPSKLDSNKAFNEYYQGVQSGKIKAGASLQTSAGRMQVQGVAGVMKINGILCKQIFDHNQFVTETKTDEATRPAGFAVVPVDPVDSETGKLCEREFFVEESYVIPWMYPYLTPHGLIMKINSKPTKITKEMIKNDHAFWGWYVNRLVNDSKFTRDIVARKTFSKLRSAIAGLYAARGERKEAEHAFKQAVALYPLSPEATSRLANLYMLEKRFAEAKEVLRVFAEADTKNDRIGEFINQVDRVEKMQARRVELEKKLRAGQGADIGKAFELLQIYNALGEGAMFRQLHSDILRTPNIPPEGHLQLAQMLAQLKRFDYVEKTFVHYLKKKPEDSGVWMELAAVRIQLQRPVNKVLEAVQKAVGQGGEPIRAALRKDPRFNAMRPHPQFKALVPMQISTPFKMNSSLPLTL